MALAESRRTLTFYYDYVSHNAYLAWVKLPELADRYGLEIEPVAVLFAGLLNAHGQLGPAEIPAKAVWMARDVIRKAARLGVPLRPPASHPFNPLLPLRVCSLDHSRDQRRALIDAFWTACWVDGRDVSRADVVAAVVDSVGLDGSALVSAAGTPDARQRLREQTAGAVALGVFGVPTLRVGGELFWGFDDFPHLELYLEGEDPLDDASLEGWMRLKPSSQRTRKSS